jgi:hypothetical protein
MTTIKKCEHSACTCPALSGKRYCSDICRMASTSNPEKLVPCRCGHADCAGDPQVHTKPEHEAPKAATPPPHANAIDAAPEKKVRNRTS